MAASVDDLLREAERHAWSLVQSAPAARRDVTEPGVPPEGGHARVAAAAERLRVRQWHRDRAETLAAGWTEFAPAASRLLGSIPGSGHKDPLRDALLAVGESRRPAEVDPHLRRVTECIGAVADLLQGQPLRDGWERDGSALRERCVRLLSSVATTTQGHLENMSRNGRLGGGLGIDVEMRDLAEKLRAARVAPGEPSLLGDVIAPRLGEASLDGFMQQWRAMALRSVDPHNAASASDGLKTVAADLAVAARGAAALMERIDAALGVPLAESSCRGALAASQSWMTVVTEWPVWLRAGGPPAHEQVVASRQLREVFSAVIRGEAVTSSGAELPRGWQVETVARRVLSDVEAVGGQCASTVRVLASSEAFVAPARQLVAGVARDPARAEEVTGVDPVPELYRSAAVRNKWVPVDAGAPCVERLCARIEDAHSVSRSARVQTRSVRKAPSQVSNMQQRIRDIAAVKASERGVSYGEARRPPVRDAGSVAREEWARGRGRG